MNSFIKKEIGLFEEKYFKNIESGVDLIDKIVKYLCKHKGKMLRPKLAIYTAKVLGEVNDKTYRVASLVEMIHVATLIHDDIVDESYIRRGWPTISKVWKNKLSVLVGDYLFSKALTTTVQLGDLKSISILSNASDRLSKGEIFQIQQSRNKNMTEEMYYKMISDKTASLFSATCELSAKTSTTDEEKILSFKKFGENFGIAYQLKDDIFDIIGKTEDLGKPSNFDLKRNMLTLPLIHCLDNLKSNQRADFLSRLKSLSKRKKIKEIKCQIDMYGGLDYAKEALDNYIEESKKNISNFPNNNELISFIDNVFYGKK
tara:strand:- start:9722 stop:10669 length:948 start_codon:yes stop_codon:yes gene_type:complete